MMKISILVIFLQFCSTGYSVDLVSLGEDLLKELSPENIINDITSGLWINDGYINKNSTQILEGMGFKTEVHEVITEDGYKLNMIRIINPHYSNRSNLKPVYAQHGLLSNSDFYIFSTYTQKLHKDGLYNEKGHKTSCTVTSGDKSQVFATSFALMLAACGYDVWLGNFRGNYYSDKHVNLTQRDLAYWEYSIDSLSDYDVPSMVDHVIAKTGKASIAYVGHSMGTTSMFQLMAAKPEYQSKVDTFIAIAPVVQMSHIISPLLSILSAIYELPGFPIISALPINPFLLPAKEWTAFRQNILAPICRIKAITPVCLLLANIIVGFGKTNTNLIPQGVGHFPETTSFMLLEHYGQRIDSNFTIYRYDFGLVANLEIYGTDKPPAYNITSIDHKKIALVWGTHDALASPADVQYLIKSLPNINISYEIANYNHIDFTLGRDSDIKITKWFIETMASLYPK